MSFRCHRLVVELRESRLIVSRPVTSIGKTTFLWKSDGRRFSGEDEPCDCFLFEWSAAWRASSFATC